MLAANVGRTKRYLSEGLSIEEISKKIKRPIEYVNECVRIIEEAKANQERNISMKEAKQNDNIKILYLCDQKKCKNCSFPECEYTSDFEHSLYKTREDLLGVYFECKPMGDTLIFIEI